ncbi:MAG TPA: aminotransferase class III-fold pyridoxal phosphate-dependent enzyme [Chloroflexota bacterium]|nr:aminotransferase class III-fold pyridoxal phosphate-dependent enzyme [Chloroflexota bacterium]
MMYGFPTDASRELDNRLQRSLPGGNTRTTIFYLPYPIALARGAGYRVWDVDGNEYIDLVNNYTSLIHGHAAPAIVAAITAQAQLGTAFSSPSALQAEMAERLCSRITSIEWLRFTNSGTESNMAAVRAARAFTGRAEIVKAFEGYHGSWEQVHTVADPAQAPTGADLARLGIPGPEWDLAHQVPYNDCAALEETMRAHGDRIAAIILEPMLFSGGVISGTPEYFALARDLADRHGALLILDEVVTSRMNIGGQQAVLGVRPDLTTLGKYIGGGLPFGAVGGRADVMDVFNPRHASYVQHSGTFNGNHLTLAAGLAALDLLPASEIERINALGEALAAGLDRAFSAARFPATTTRCGSLVQIHCDDPATMARLHLAALGEGLYTAQRGMMNISTPMDDAVIGQVIDAFERAIAHTMALEPALAP